MARLPAGLSLAAIVLLALAAVAGSSRLSGPVLLSFGGAGGHGIHLGDLAVFLIACAGAAGVLSLRRN